MVYVSLRHWDLHWRVNHTLPVILVYHSLSDDHGQQRYGLKPGPESDRLAALKQLEFAAVLTGCISMGTYF